MEDLGRKRAGKIYFNLMRGEYGLSFGKSFIYSENFAQRKILRSKIALMKN
jgi:hypothetical protein